MSDITCQQLKQELSLVKTDPESFILSLGKALTIVDLNTTKQLQSKLVSSIEDLEKLLDPYNINLRRKLAKELQAEFISVFKEGIAWVEKDDKYFYIDTQGKEITSDKFDDAGDFSEGIARVKKDNKYFYIDTQGKEITSERFVYARDFSEGIARVKKDNKYFYIDTQGKEITSDKFDDAGDFLGGIAWVEKDNKLFYIDKKGKRIF